MKIEPSIAVCISTRNRSRELQRCVRSICSQDFPLAQIELLVFDDASDEENAANLRHLFSEFQNEGFARAELLRSEVNVRMLAGRQKLAQRAKGDALLFLDDDGEVLANSIPLLSQALAQDCAIAAAGPRIVNEQGRPLHVAGFVGGWSGRFFDRDADQLLDCDWLNTTCCLVRRSAFLKVGGFDVSFQQSNAEADLGLRLKAAGYRLVYQPQAQAIHRIDSPVRRERLYHLYRNKLWLIRKHFPLARRISALSLHLLGSPRYFLESMRFHHGIDKQEWTRIACALIDGLFSPLGSNERGW